MFADFQSYLAEKAGMTAEEFGQSAGLLQSKTIAKGKYLLREGEVCRDAFFVEKGLLRSFSLDESGKEHVIQFAPENWYVSDRSSMYFGKPSDFFIEAIEESQVVLMGRDFLKSAAQISPGFGEFNDKLLHNHILHLQKRINLLLGATAEKRYLDFITLYPDLLLRVPQWMVASYLGITPESLSRVRKELARRNFKPL
jgi:CRP-like cAMP-binding protein